MLTKAQRGRIKAALESKRRELVADIRAQARNLAIADGVHDPIDVVQNTASRDQAVDHVRRLSEMLSSVEHSLRALSDGCYGYCVDCDDPIGARRLEVIPWAHCCVRCQTRREAADFLVSGPSREGREAA